MYKTTNHDIDNYIAVSDNTLAIMLDCGKATAVAISKAAGARKKFGKRALNKIDTIKEYIKSLPTESEDK